MTNSNQSASVISESSKTVLDTLAENFKAKFTKTTDNYDDSFITISLPLSEFNRFTSEIFDFN